MTNQEEQLATLTRSELSSIPVFVPKQRYQVYSRHWSSHIEDNIEHEYENEELTNSKNQIKHQNTWSCIVLSALFTVLFYAIFLAIVSVIAIYIYRAAKKKSTQFEMKYENRTTIVGI